MMAMMERHAGLEEIFLEHQTALLDRDVARAREALARYGERLAAHMAEEESAILPLYESRCPQPPGGTTRMFLDEHRKLRELLADLAAAADALPAGPDPKTLLAVLDRETQFKNYMDHHDRRERAFLYPALDAALPDGERAVLLASLGFR